MRCSLIRPPLTFRFGQAPVTLRLELRISHCNPSFKMAHQLFWPGKYFFYPIGNTSATCLTRDISPDESAHILLLGCGDPRNVLYTIHSEPRTHTRQLDFTCCDFDAAVLARNVLLFTMVLDEKPITTTVWNIFFHMYLDKDSHSILVQQCKKLIACSESSQQWNDSPYGSCLRMCTDYTIQELRRHWSLYAEMQDLPFSRLKAIRKSFTDLSNSILKSTKSNLSPARSAGPAFLLAMSITAEHFRHYWKTGLTFTDDRNIIAAATFLNPTFAYSLAGEECAVHYGIDPLVPFHHAALFGNAKKTPSMADLVKSSKASFDDWCASFKSLRSRCVLRFFLGEVTAVCAALRAFADTGSLNIGIPAMRWKMPLIQLSSAEYISGSAPHVFNVIDTSNLEDYIGLLNVVISAVPLLSRSTPSSTLYTESLVLNAQENVTQHFQDRLYVNITVSSLLFGICPVDYLSSFSSRCNTTEIAIAPKSNKRAKAATQFHRVTTWKFTTSGDIFLRSSQNPPMFNDLTQLGTLLYDMYHAMFEQEDAGTFHRLNESNLYRAVLHSNIIHYNRETFVLMLKLIRKNLQIPSQSWREVMDRFNALQSADTSMPMDSVNYNDLCVHLHRHSVYTAPIYHLPSTRSGIFSAWPSIPPIVRVFLIVPRSALAPLKEIPSEQIGTSPLQCSVKGQWSCNIFCSVHAAFGRVIPTGTSGHPSVLFEEDEGGWKGGPSSSLVVSFVMSSGLLTDLEPQQNINVSFNVRSTPGNTGMLVPKMGLDLAIFSAKMVDKNHVIVIPEKPLPQPSAVSNSVSPSVKDMSPSPLASDIGTLNPVVVELDEQCDLLTLFTCRVVIENHDVRRAFGTAGEMPDITQVSPCVMRLTISGHNQDIAYPFPVMGSNNKLRLARKSLWVEVVVPVSAPLKPDGMKLTPFPVIRLENNHNPISWNIHRLNLSTLPTLSLTGNKEVETWLNIHIGSSMSARERALQKKKQDDTLMHVKHTLISIFGAAAGLQNSGPPRNLFALRDVASKNCDTIFFISDIKYDLSCHTMVCDGYVLPLTHDIMPKFETRFHHLLSEKAGMVDVAINKGEVQAWKQLLPVLVERCRTSWTHKPDCEYKSQGKIPLTEEMELDPLCSCGRGKDVEGMRRVALWREYAPYVTRVALSPLFAVSYLDPIGRDPSKYKCFVCRGVGKPKVRWCSACKKVQYCSPECQKKDWKAHKPRCKAQ